MKTCIICREQHPPQGLSFDSKGINSCGMYRTRLATFVCHPDVSKLLGPVMEAAPELAAALEKCYELLDNSSVRAFISHTLGEQARLHEAINLSRKALVRCDEFLHSKEFPDATKL